MAYKNEETGNVIQLALGETVYISLHTATHGRVSANFETSKFLIPYTVMGFVTTFSDIKDGETKADYVKLARESSATIKTWDVDNREDIDVEIEKEITLPSSALGKHLFITIPNEDFIKVED